MCIRDSRETGRLNDLIERLLKLKRIKEAEDAARVAEDYPCLLYTSPSPRDRTRSRMPSSA